MAETFHPVYFYIVRIGDKQLIWHMHENEMNASLDEHTKLGSGPFISREEAEGYMNKKWRRQPASKESL